MSNDQDNSIPTILGRSNFVNEIHGKSDRAVAVIGVASLDTQLSQLLENFFIDDFEEARSLLDDERPIGNFGTRIRLSNALGLISREERDELWSLMQIREFFVREMGVVHFADDPVREWCYWLRLPRKIFIAGQTMTPRKLFVSATALLGHQLALRIEQAAAMRRNTAPDFSSRDISEIK